MASMRQVEPGKMGVWNKKISGIGVIPKRLKKKLKIFKYACNVENEK
jgi:hypothetical protein